MPFRISKDIFKAAVLYDRSFLQIRGGDPGMEPLLGSGGKAPKSRRQVVKIMQNNSSTERLAGTTTAQKHFTTFPEGHDCGRPCRLHKRHATLSNSKLLTY